MIQFVILRSASEQFVCVCVCVCVCLYVFCVYVFCVCVVCVCVLCVHALTHPRGLTETSWAHTQAMIYLNRLSDFMFVAARSDLFYCIHANVQHLRTHARCICTHTKKIKKWHGAWGKEKCTQRERESRARASRARARERERDRERHRERDGTCTPVQKVTAKKSKW